MSPNAAVLPIPDEEAPTVEAEVGSAPATVEAGPAVETSASAAATPAETSGVAGCAVVTRSSGLSRHWPLTIPLLVAALLPNLLT